MLGGGGGGGVHSPLQGQPTPHIFLWSLTEHFSLGNIHLLAWFHALSMAALAAQIQTWPVSQKWRSAEEARWGVVKEPSQDTSSLLKPLLGSLIAVISPMLS